MSTTLNPNIISKPIKLNDISGNIFSKSYAFFKLLAELGKIKITAFVAITVGIGYILFSSKIDWILIYTGFAVFILAMGSSGLNHFQERKFDALMNRTKNRPIPSGRISAKSAIAISIIEVSIGFLMLSQLNFVVLILGAITLVWYNFIYTPLKRKNVMAVIPGSIIGALPPMIGYAAAEGSILNYDIITLAVFFFVWQIPHFWLLVLLFGSDYKKAGFPSLTQMLPMKILGKITYLMILVLFITSFGLITSINWSSLILVSGVILAGLGLMFSTFSITKIKFETSIVRRSFIFINIYALVVICLIAIDKLT